MFYIITAYNRLRRTNILIFWNLIEEKGGVIFLLIKTLSSNPVRTLLLHSKNVGSNPIKVKSE